MRARRLLAALVVGGLTVALGVAGARPAGALGDTSAGAARPVAEGDGGALALWIVAEVVVLVVGVAALRLWTDRRRPALPRPRSGRHDDEPSAARRRLTS